MSNRMVWLPVEDGTYWNDIRTRAIAVEKDGKWITTFHDGDPGCPVDLTDGVRLMRQVEADGDGVTVPSEVRATIRDLLQLELDDIAIGGGFHADPEQAKVKVEAALAWLDEMEAQNEPA